MFDSIRKRIMEISDEVSKRSYAYQKKTRHRRIWTVVGVVVALIALLIGGGVIWANAKFNQIEKIDDPFADISKIEGHERPEKENKSVSFLVLGSDSRVSAGDPSQWEAGAQRTDAIMIAQLSGDRQSVNVMSIPRDSWVSIPGHGEAKINASYSYGGPSLAIATVEQTTGIPIDHLAIVDFNSFVGLTDAVGGVEMTTATEGTRTYHGQEALAFVRERYNLPGGDFDRVRRQQLWMKSVMSKLLTQETLSSPTKLLNIYDQVSPYVAIDEGFGFTEMTRLAPSLTGLRSSGFNFMTAPVDGTGTSADGQSIVLLNEADFSELTEAFQNDNVEAYIKESGDKIRTLDSEPVQ